MKMKWLFLMFYVGITTNVLAQDIYVPGKIAEGKSAAYHCVANGIFLRLYNVNNSDTTWTMVYKNGESASAYEPEALPLFKQEELIEIFCSELTAEELDKIRGKYGYFLGLMAMRRRLISGLGTMIPYCWLSVRTDFMVWNKG